MITVLAGGAGGAKYLRGLLETVEPAQVTAVVNTADDVWMHGLRVCPDLDSCTYTLADAIDPERGWGLAGESWRAMESLRRYDEARAWFNLGDRDLGTHLYRTSRIFEGATLSEVTAEIARGWGLGARLLPMTDDEVGTMIELPGGEEIGWQEYFVARRHEVTISGVRFAGIGEAAPAPGVLEAIGSSERVVVGPSNPIVSIGPILAVSEILDALVARRDDVVAISPIVGGAALKGPADRMLRELGQEASVVGVARLYAGVASVLVVDTADAELAPAVEAEGLRCVVTPTVMHGVAEAAALAAVTLA